MNVCDMCDRGRHFRCTGCKCALCPIVLRKPALPSRPMPKPRERMPVVKMLPGALDRRTIGGSQLPAPMQQAIKVALREGTSKAEIARRSGVTRAQVKYLAKSLQS